MYMYITYTERQYGLNVLYGTYQHVCIHACTYKS